MPENEYVFHFPFVSTPCFLIDLGKAVTAQAPLKTQNGEPYRWHGGAGPNHSIVAYSAICAHRMSHPTPAFSFIGYRRQAVGFYTRENDVEHRAGVIQCCSEQSIYDPADGARVLGGPAPQPLASIALEITESGIIHATGVYGANMFDPYFETFGERLILEYERLDIEAPIGENSTALPIEEFTRNQIRCS